MHLQFSTPSPPPKVADLLVPGWMERHHCVTLALMRRIVGASSATCPQPTRQTHRVNAHVHPRPAFPGQAGSNLPSSYAVPLPACAVLYCLLCYMHCVYLDT
ncbi:hypothetical protein K431DRAFT_120308 [Polychaeton citri CBS 116435]|uniref:Uncharacterized protein n=1 Tax=Polychaeton citri CBS 116435 TaxID=1314669 RepID=A0A9P4UMY3_9PEZI|nr:hypothetical protein K431DRAFT_120308 [Polychaeton citri CBS 116435]